MKHAAEIDISFDQRSRLPRGLSSYMIVWDLGMLHLSNCTVMKCICMRATMSWPNKGNGKRDSLDNLSVNYCQAIVSWPSNANLTYIIECLRKAI